MPFSIDEWDEETTETEAVPAEQLTDGEPSMVVMTGVNAGEAYRLAADAITIGRSHDSVIRLPGLNVSRVHCVVRRTSDGVVLEDRGSRNGTFVDGKRVDHATLAEGDKILIGRTVLRFGYQDDLDVSYQRRLYEAAVRDDLTGAYNKRYFRERLDTELAFSRRHSLPLSVLLFDLDHFKAINDEHGHPAGDELLRAFCERISAVARRGDELARIGGEEFAVCARATEPGEARALGERMRAAIEALTITAGAKTVSVTTSIGIASYPRDVATTGSELMAIADRALYRAKRGGRNRVEATRDDWDSESTPAR